MDIKAIETTYNSILFRSRIEARWAVFFDVLGIAYEYEPEKFQTSHGRYIPDFRVTVDDEQYLIEIKGAPPTEEAIDKLRELNAGGVIAMVTHGMVGQNYFVTPGYVSCCELEVGLQFSQCVICGVISISCSVHASTHSCSADEAMAMLYGIDLGFRDFTSSRNLGNVTDSPLLILAMEAARSCRFEDPKFVVTIETFKRTASILKDNAVFGTSLQLNYFHKAALALSNDPECPRFRKRRAA